MGVKVPIYRFEQERGHEHVGQSIFKLQAENAVCQTKKEKNLLFVFDIYYKEVAYCKYQQGTSLTLKALTQKRKTYQK